MNVRKKLHKVISFQNSLGLALKKKKKNVKKYLCYQKKECLRMCIIKRKHWIGLYKRMCEIIFILDMVSHKLIRVTVMIIKILTFSVPSYVQMESKMETCLVLTGYVFFFFFFFFFG
jgi:hypothetical protein